MAYHQPIPHPKTRRADWRAAAIEGRDPGRRGGLSPRARLAIIVLLSIALWLSIALALFALLG